VVAEGAYEDGRWVTVSESNCGNTCLISFEWTDDDGTLALANAAAGEGGEITPGIRFHTEGVFQRQ
jgi:hypothetical protein